MHQVPPKAAVVILMSKERPKVIDLGVVALLVVLALTLGL